MPLMSFVFFNVSWHSLKGSLEFNSIDRLSTQLYLLHLQTALQSSTLETFNSRFQTLLSVSRQARTALPSGFILTLPFKMCWALNFNHGHGARRDYVTFSHTVYSELIFYPLFSSVRSQPAIEYTSVDLIKRLSCTNRASSSACILPWETSANTFALCQFSPGLLQTKPVSTPCFPLQSPIQFGHVFSIVCLILSTLFRYLNQENMLSAVFQIPLQLRVFLSH